MAEHEDEVVGVYELLDAIEGVIQAADPTKREFSLKPLMLMPRTSPTISIGRSDRRPPRC